MTLHELSDDNYQDWVRMRYRLWEDSPADCAAAYIVYLEQLTENRALNLIATSDSGSPIGFLEASLRTDYVPGADLAPIWYVEGIYTEDHARKQGVARALVDGLIERVGVSKLASSCDLDNEESRLFHEAIGFQEVGRHINFIKHLP